MHPSLPTVTTVPLTKSERAFFAQLGSRIAAQRKEQGITQVELAEVLGVSQQTITAYESGRRRIQVSTLPIIAKALGTTVETLMGDTQSSTRKRGPVPKLQQQLEQLQRLPKDKQRLVSQLIESVLAQAER